MDLMVTMGFGKGQWDEVYRAEIFLLDWMNFDPKSRATLTCVVHDATMVFFTYSLAWRTGVSTTFKGSFIHKFHPSISLAQFLPFSSAKLMSKFQSTRVRISLISTLARLDDGSVSLARFIALQRIQVTYLFPIQSLGP